MNEQFREVTNWLSEHHCGNLKEKGSENHDME